MMSNNNHMPPMMGGNMNLNSNPGMGQMMPGMGGNMNPGMGQGNMDPGIGVMGAMGPVDPSVGMSVYKPQGAGTMLADLIKDDNSVGSTGSSRRGGDQSQQQSLRYSQPQGQSYVAAYNSDVDRYSSKRRGKNQRYDRSYDSSKDSLSDSESEYNSIRDLAADVNNSLLALENIEHTKKKKKRQDTESEKDDSDDDHNEKEDYITVETIEHEADYLKTLTEFLLLLTLYVIMSQPFVVSMASGYIHQLNPTDEGTISMTGIIIYGLILTVMFMVVRKLIFSRM